MTSIIETATGYAVDTKPVRWWADLNQIICPKCARLDHPEFKLPDEAGEGGVDHLMPIFDPLPDHQCPQCGHQYRVCCSCGEPVDENTCQYAQLAGADIDESCYESDLEYSGNIGRYVASDEGHERVRFGDYVAEAMREGDPLDELPKWFTDCFGKRSRIPTDAWRGYYQVEWKGLVAIAEGWLTGTPDPGVKGMETALKLQEILRSGTLPPIPLYWCFDLTSNVFSQVSELLVDEGNEDKMIAWLKDQGIEIEALRADF